MPELQEEAHGNASTFSAPKIAVAVSKGRSGFYALKWALEKEVPAHGLVHLIHVQSLLHWVPNALGAKFPVEQARPEVVKRFKKERFLETEKLVNQYKSQCDKKKIKSKVCYSESDSVQKELVSQISKFGITKLVLGTSSQSALSRALKKQSISTYVTKHAPGFCVVMTVYKGKLCPVKDATQGLMLHCSSPSNSAASDTNISVVRETNRGSDDGFEDDSRTNNDIQDGDESMWSGVTAISISTLSQRPSVDFSTSSSEWLLLQSRSNNGAFLSPPMNVMIRNHSGPSASQFSECTPAIPVHQSLNPVGYNSEIQASLFNEANSPEGICFDSNAIMREFTAVAAADESFYRTSESIQHCSCDALSQSSVDMGTSSTIKRPETQGPLDVHENGLMGPSMAFANNVVMEHERCWVKALRKEEDAMEQAMKDARSCEAALAALQRDHEVIRQMLAEEVKRHQDTQTELETQKRMADAYVREAALAKQQAEAERSRFEETTVKLEDTTRNLDAERQLRQEAEEKASLEAVAKLDALDALRKEQQRYSEYTFQELQSATNNFNEENKLGEGGYGPVYKGKLRHTTVAIKVLAQDRSHGREEFQSEVEILSRLHHPHMLMLLGSCPEKGCIVYEYMANGSLEDRLNQKNGTPPLPWYVRFRICLEVATALLFLHSQPQPIVHRDLKPGNILLDRHFVSKIGDVGLARLVPNNITFSVTIYNDSVPVGTFAYIDPDYQRTGVVSCECDVYSLGIVMLQLLTGRPAVGVPALVEAAENNGKLEEVLDKSAGEWPLEEARKLARLSLRCAEPKRRNRPKLETDILPELESIQNVAETAAANMSCVRPSSSGTRPTLPSCFFCPILQEIMENPHVAADGFTYEHDAIKVWLQANYTSPMTNMRLEHRKLTPNHALRSSIKDWHDNGLI